MDGVLNWLWQGGLVAVAAFVMLFVPRIGANVRYAVCWAALLLVIALPAFPAIAFTTPAADALHPTQNVPIISLPDAWWTSAVVILAAWAIWAGIQFVRFVSAIVRVRRARARSQAFPLHVEAVLPHWRRARCEGRRATLVLSNSVSSAAVLGLGAPMIAVAPSLVRTLDPDDLDRVLIHEWAHVQRHDDVVNIAQSLVRIVAGWHPALWWIDRRLHLEREIACDETTVEITGSPKSYAECLLKLSMLRATPRAMQIAPAVLTPSSLRARVVTIVSPHRTIGAVWSRTLAAAIVFVLCVLSVAVGGLTMVEVTSFAQPLVSGGTFPFNISSNRPVPIAPTLSSDINAERSPRRGHGLSTRQRPNPEQASPQSPVESTPVPVSQEPDVVDSTDTADAAPEPPTVMPEVASAPHTQQPAREATAEPSPWTAAAAGGKALGGKSRDAGVATAGAFTRFARRVAGSF